VLPTLQDQHVTLRPLEEGDLDELARIVGEPSAREWWGPLDDLDELRNEGCAFAIEVDGELAGWLGYSEENDPQYRHAGLDIVLAPGFQGRGLGPSALRLAARWLIDERGHHRLTIDPAAENERAIHVYKKVGFRPVGVLRRYERAPDGRWRDGLLMDLLADELV
jgi:aminoglycoside 6'-N-acetyltransferase